VKEEEECSSIIYPLVKWRLEARAISPNQCGVTTSPMNGVTVLLNTMEYFKVFNPN
jgi:hypothetical protein